MAASSCATLALCSSLTTHCKISINQNPNPPLLLSLSKSKLCSSSALYTRPAFSFTPKFSQSEAPVLESEPEAEAEAVAEAVAEAEIVESTAEDEESTATEQPKREEVFAVVMVSNISIICLEK